MAFSEPLLQAARRLRACSQRKSHPQNKRAPREAGLGVAPMPGHVRAARDGRDSVFHGSSGWAGARVRAAAAPMPVPVGPKGLGSGRDGAVGGRRPSVLRPTCAFLAFTALMPQPTALQP